MDLLYYEALNFTGLSVKQLYFIYIGFSVRSQLQRKY